MSEFISDRKIRYDLLMQDAMRGIIKTVLKYVAANGLPGEHHFFIVFDTTHPGVQLSERIQAQYPDEMTIVLQHQFWGLQVHDTAFEVQLSFNNKIERLVIPFTAIKGFVDPSVTYGFHIGGTDAPKSAAHLNMLMPHSDSGHESKPEPSASTAVTAEIAKVRDRLRDKASIKRNEEADQKAEPVSTDKPQSAEIVELDQFRKK